MVAIIDDWVVSTSYVVGETVVYSDATFRCAIAHTSVSFTTDLGVGRWVRLNVSGVTGDTGSTGTAGPTGATGAAGAAGAGGSNGSNGIFSAITSLGDAQAGTDNTDGMTSLRVSQAIIAQAAALAEIIALNAANVDRVTDIAELASRLQGIEGSFVITHAVGEQNLNNNVGPIDMDAVAGEAGRGNVCFLSQVGSHSAEIIVEVFRKDSLENRFSRHFLTLHYIDTGWVMSEKEEIFLEGIESGVTFTITDTAGVAQVEYTTDNMAGVYDTVASKIRWQIRELPRSYS